eukprot:g474.t1
MSAFRKTYPKEYAKWKRLMHAASVEKAQLTPFDVLMRTVNGRGTSATTTTSSADKDDDAYDDDGEWTTSTAAIQVSTTTTTASPATVADDDDTYVFDDDKTGNDAAVIEPPTTTTASPATVADDDDTYAFDDDKTGNDAAVIEPLTTTTTSAKPLLRGHAEDHSNTMHTDARKTHSNRRGDGSRSTQRLSAKAWNAHKNRKAGAHNEAQHKHKLQRQQQQKRQPDEFKSKEEAKLTRFNKKHPERFHKLIARERKMYPERFNKHREKWLQLGVLTTTTTSTTTSKPTPRAPPLNGKCGDLMLVWAHQNLGLRAHRGCL